MKTECNTDRLDFQPAGRREVRAQFDGGTITSDAGVLLLREVEARSGILQRFAECFTDYRHPDLIEHTAKQLVTQRVYGLALGYEDLNDHDELRLDPLLAAMVGKHDPTPARPASPARPGQGPGWQEYAEPTRVDSSRGRYEQPL